MDKQQFLDECAKAIRQVAAQVDTVEEAVDDLVCLLLLKDNLRQLPEIKDIFDALGNAELSRETSYAQPIGSWDKTTADSLKEAEWRQVVAAIEAARKSL